MEHEGDSDTNCNWSSRNNHQRVGTKAGGLRNQRTSRDYPDCSIIKIDQNAEKDPGDLGSFAVTQTPVRNHRLTLV